MGTINIFPYLLAVAVYKSHREKEVNTMIRFQRGVAWGSPACSDFKFYDACVEGG